MMGGKPSKGTSADRRLKANPPAAKKATPTMMTRQQAQTVMRPQRKGKRG